MYEAIKTNDTVDADGDGVAASVGLSLVGRRLRAGAGGPAVDQSDRHRRARSRRSDVYHYLFVDALRNGTFDVDLDGDPDEPHPEWKGTLDWLGVQYYSRIGVTGSPALFPVVNVTPCFKPLRRGALPAARSTRRTRAADGLRALTPPGSTTVLQRLRHALASRCRSWSPRPASPPTSARAAPRSSCASSSRSIARARAASTCAATTTGASDDNFEWAEGYGPKFGLYSVDLTTYARTPTDGATTFGDIAGTRKLSSALREKSGGNGPMTPEEVDGLRSGICVQVK